MESEPLSHIERDGIVYQHTVHGISVEALAEAFEQTVEAIEFVLKRRGVSVPMPHRGPPPGHTEQFTMKQLQELLKTGMSQGRAARTLGVSGAAITQRLKRHAKLQGQVGRE
jgi:hypothetical protein